VTHQSSPINDQNLDEQRGDHGSCDCAMYYTGMAAMRMSQGIEPLLFAVSISFF
jgi:hypothetical protein